MKKQKIALIIGLVIPIFCILSLIPSTYRLFNNTAYGASNSKDANTTLNNTSKKSPASSVSTSKKTPQSKNDYL